MFVPGSAESPRREWRRSEGGNVSNLRVKKTPRGEQVPNNSSRLIRFIFEGRWDKLTNLEESFPSRLTMVIVQIRGAIH